MAIDLSTLTARQALTAIYIGYYDRAADPAGLAFWEDVVDADGFNLVSITTLFASASETQALFPFFADPSSTTPSAFITQLYQNLFNRDPDAEGLAFWTEQLQNAVDGAEGALTVGQIITSIIEGAQEADAAIIMNKIEVALDWTDSANAVGAEFDLDGVTGASARSIIDDVDGTDSSVVTAKATTDAFFAAGGGGAPVVPGETIILSADSDARDNLTGTEGNDTFEAYNMELMDGDTMNGGSGRDTLTFFNSDDGRTAISARTESVETVVVTNQSNDQFSTADNNVGGYNGFLSGDQTVMVDVELDAGRMSGVTRWEDFDSRADLVIEDARDQDDTDGTFTGDITVAMVSTDPGNVDYAVYFDQPVNTSQNFGTLEIRVLDQEAAFGQPAPSAGSTGYLTESSLISFAFQFDGQPITVTLADELGVTYGPNVSFQDLLDQVENATQQALVDAGVTANLGFTAALGAPASVGVGNQFTLPLVLTFNVPADTITASSNDVIVLGRDSGNNGATPSTDTFGALSTVRITEEELIRLNVELDDVGKGSMGGDALFGAMSTGRQDGDDGTSDSIGIQQFDIEVDRSSQLQTINSTNNALEVVNITNGENDGPNNTTTAADEMIGDLTVRGVANPGLDSDGNNTSSGIATDGPMPGAVPQHNEFGFSDVRVINGAAMVGALDITAELTEEVVEKYLDIQDGGSNGETDDVDFTYNLGTNNDEFLLNMSSAALNAAGTGSREDFDMSVSGGAGNDVITTNVGTSVKRIDEQGQDHYELTTENGTGAASWYTNAVSNVAAEFSVNGGAGADTIWTHGWGDVSIDGGADADVIYTDNSGAVEARINLATNIERNLTEHDQIDYVVGGVWAFNAENITAAGTPPVLGMTGATNDLITLGTVAGVSTTTPLTATSGNATFTVSYAGASGVAAASYNITITIPFSELNISSTSGLVTVSEQALNQAIKAGINGDAILSNLLEAADGPGNSLVVASKTDGTHVASDLALAYTSLTVNNASVASTGETFSTNAGYTTTGANFINLGSASLAESDNTIRSGSDNADDLFVLSTNDAGIASPTTVNGTLAATGHDLNEASNETIEFDNGFGRDTVLNFDIGDGSRTTTPAGATSGEDILDFDLLFADNSFAASTLAATLGALPGGESTVNGEVTVVAEVTGSGPTSNDTLAELQAIFSAADGGTSAARAEEIVIVFDAADNNAGAVYSVNDGTAANDVVVAFEGTINLVGTDWTTLTLDNFA
ncbi:DUF4214 domain-containing protein [Sulfitobacter pacificus]|uniref:DUF4214 domain-containing protein n=1 Tax=Sulfitobacter pacificus TaxID=1499314 RepID=UPI003623DC89